MLSGVWSVNLFGVWESLWDCFPHWSIKSFSVSTNGVFLCRLALTASCRVDTQLTEHSYWFSQKDIQGVQCLPSVNTGVLLPSILAAKTIPGCGTAWGKYLQTHCPTMQSAETVTAAGQANNRNNFHKSALNYWEVLRQEINNMVFEYWQFYENWWQSFGNSEAPQAENLPHKKLRGSRRAGVQIQQNKPSYRQMAVNPSRR